MKTMRLAEIVCKVRSHKIPIKTHCRVKWGFSKLWKSIGHIRKSISVKIQAFHPFSILKHPEFAKMNIQPTKIRINYRNSILPYKIFTISINRSHPPLRPWPQIRLHPKNLNCRFQFILYSIVHYTAHPLLFSSLHSQ